MFWSISESRTFRNCQRQWYYKNFLGNAVAKDHVQHTAVLKNPVACDVRGERLQAGTGRRWEGRTLLVC